ncbi:gp19.5 family protein [Pseudomonas chlororaphis]|uniref:gp19.5 family protein n=1 Tax=Pseudomonas chlororaphis TaxID=587753 RepID=UPI00406C5B4D
MTNIHLTHRGGLGMTNRWTTYVAVICTLATYRVTYRFLGLLLVAFGVSQGGPLGAKPLEMSSVFYSVAVLIDAAVLVAQSHRRGYVRRKARA